MVTLTGSTIFHFKNVQAEGENFENFQSLCKH